MDRIENLVEKLKEQTGQKADPRQLLVTVQLLQQELLQHIGNTRNLGTSKVAVVMPGANTYPAHYEKYAPKPAEQAQPQPAEQPQPQPDPVVVKQPVLEEVAAPVYTPPPIPVPPAKEYFQLEEEPEPNVQKNGQIDLHFDPMTEIPTLSQQVQDKIAAENTGAASLNDKLKQEKSELQHRLNEAPIKDLRKAVGINDRFLFINELFRGDEAMYERSIKTINGFNIYPEAEYWITRELKTKLGWSIDSETVAHFDQLVKRRFS